MTRNEIIEQVNELLANEFEVEVSDITPEANIKETLSLDSLSLVDMVAAGKLQGNHPCERIAQDTIVQRPVRLH